MERSDIGSGRFEVSDISLYKSSYAQAEIVLSSITSIKRDEGRTIYRNLWDAHYSVNMKETKFMNMH